MDFFLILLLVLVSSNIRLFILIVMSPLLYLSSKRNIHNMEHCVGWYGKWGYVLSKVYHFGERAGLRWIGQIYSNHVRMFFYKYIYLIPMGEDVVIHGGCEIRNAQNLHIGRGTIIGDDAILDARCGIMIGEDVNLSSRVSIWTEQHDYRDPDFGGSDEHRGPVIIKNRAWIGPHSVILRKVTIGEGSVVAAGGVITKDISPFTVVGGVPGKVIGERPKNLRYHFNGRQPHFY